MGCDLYGNWPGLLIDELQISMGEKSPAAIRSSAVRNQPFEDH